MHLRLSPPGRRWSIRHPLFRVWVSDLYHFEMVSQWTASTTSGSHVPAHHVSTFNVQRSVVPIASPIPRASHDHRGSPFLSDIPLPRRLLFCFLSPLAAEALRVPAWANNRPAIGCTQSVYAVPADHEAYISLDTTTWCGIFPPGNDDDQHRRPGSRLAFCAVRECVPDSLPRRPECDSAAGEGRVQKGRINLQPVIRYARPILFRYQIREVDEWEKDIKAGGKYFFIR